MPPLALEIVSYISLATKLAPTAKQLYADGKAIVDRLFKGGVITADQQNQIKAWADAHQAATLAGQVPPAFTVEADPT